MSTFSTHHKITLIELIVIFQADVKWQRERLFRVYKKPSLLYKTYRDCYIFSICFNYVN